MRSPPQWSSSVSPASPPLRPARFLASLWQDLVYAARGARRTPGFSLVVLLTLALGIGATTAMFDVVRSVLLRPLPFPER